MKWHPLLPDLPDDQPGGYPIDEDGDEFQHETEYGKAKTPLDERPMDEENQLPF